MKPMTQAEYKEQPNLCPFCRSENIDAERWDGENGIQEVHCNDGDKRWWDVYKLVGYETIEK